MYTDKVLPLLAIFICLLPATEMVMTFDPFSPTSVPIPYTSPKLTKINSPVKCSSDQPGGFCTCDVTTAGIPFELTKLSGDTDPYVYYYGTASLVAATIYNVEVTCKENNVNPGFKRTLQVEATANKPPTITGYPTVTTSTDASNTGQYDQVYKIAYTDPEKDAVSFTMKQTPSLGLFSIGAADGIIRSTVDLRYATVSAFTLTVTANDGHNLISDFIVKLSLTNLNTVPSISNLPAVTTTVLESAKANDVIWTFNVVDPDPYVNPFVPVCATFDSSDVTKFKFTATQILVAYDNALDYETKTTYKITCTLFDGFLSSSGDETLTIFVSDVNEAPVWSSNNYFCNINEGAANVPSCILGGSVIDPEGDSFSVDISGDSGYLKFDIGLGRITFAKDYDLDQVGMAQDITAIFKAIDSKGATSSATVYVHVTDVNDNACVTNAGLTYVTLTDTDPLKTLGTLTQLDKDVTSPNKDTHFEVFSVSPKTSSDHIMVTRTGEVYYTKLFAADQAGTSFKVNVVCVDSGTPQLNTTTAVIVTYSPATTPSTTPTASTTASTTTTEADIWDKTEFKALFGSLIGLAGLLFVVGLAALVAYCCSKYRPKIKTPPKKVEPYRNSTDQLEQIRPEQRTVPSPPLDHSWTPQAWPLSNTRPIPEGTHYFHYH
ncbi:protocadherin Fat 3-like [Physella acuta]|uniref:protocadherin Fat 3-like n=1 Tax=Physella acuta TaxID=109671 RepID=UPI0027DE8F48|nr:protocadherin Fat 3-like [Physella acuta]XP_059170228.1 protocadherin Fat 3-like [Physella acuta]XP_059170231.1 protocadherin Fat 3-like [Physella acuta]XP_059170239.1 protocadherin Fat 3-like [Physella acuta]XP_059170247.1 protocadherin Fat 3-like [Physella acuta]